MSTGPFITDPKQIVLWSYEDSLALKTAAPRVHLMADGQSTPSPFKGLGPVPSLSESFRDALACSLGVQMPGSRYHLDGTADVSLFSEAEIRRDLSIAEADAVIVCSERKLRDYVKSTTGVLSSPEILTAQGFEPGFELYDAAAVERWDFPPMEYLVDQLLPRRGLTWLSGRAKRGKSLLALYLGLAIACDRDVVADHFEVKAYPNVLYICREDPGGRLKARIEDITRAWGVAPAPGRFLTAVRPRLDLSRPEHLAWLLAVCREREIGLVLLDTWTALSPTADPTGPKDQTGLAQAVANFTQTLGEAVVVLDHTRKNRQEGATSLSSAEILGPSQKWQAAEHIVMLADTKEQGRIEVFMEGKDTTTERFFLDVSPEGSEGEKFTFAGTVEEAAEARRKEGEDNLEKVFQAIVRAPSTRAQLVVVTGLSAATVKRHLKALREKGQIGVDVDVYKALVDGERPF
jgi:hypothetical protein